MSYTLKTISSFEHHAISFRSPGVKESILLSSVEERLKISVRGSVECRVLSVDYRM